MAPLQRHRQLAAPRDAEQECLFRLPLSLKPTKELGNIIKQPAEARRIAAIPVVQAGAAPVEEKDGESRPGEVLTRVFVPAAVTLDAMHADGAAERSIRWGLVATIAQAVAVTSGERLHGP